MAIGALALLSWTAWGLPLEDAELAGQRTRAEKIFAYDKTHPKHLPRHEVTALSVALKFRDEHGLKRYLDRLETRIKRSPLK